MSEPYDDIIDLPHHVSATRPRMSSASRAAQFSPFAALTGFNAAVAETARLTDERIELGDNALEVLDMKLRMLKDMLADYPEITVTYFQAYSKKEGGAYVTVTGTVTKIDDYERIIVMKNGEKIAIDDVYDIECELFDALL